ncbi:Bromodomain-containing protein 4 [Borealophlyctis nickersoniae]|nr:Bromodomain-containing protein 4 [Borealophlyctis nickersoniae]
MADNKHPKTAGGTRGMADSDWTKALRAIHSNLDELNRKLQQQLRPSPSQKTPYSPPPTPSRSPVPTVYHEYPSPTTTPLPEVGSRGGGTYAGGSYGSGSTEGGSGYGAGGGAVKQTPAETPHMYEQPSLGTQVETTPTATGPYIPPMETPLLTLATTCTTTTTLTETPIETSPLGQINCPPPMTETETETTTHILPPTIVSTEIIPTTITSPVVDDSIGLEVRKMVEQGGKGMCTDEEVQMAAEEEGSRIDTTPDADAGRLYKPVEGGETGLELIHLSSSGSLLEQEMSTPCAQGTEAAQSDAVFNCGVRDVVDITDSDHDNVSTHNDETAKAKKRVLGSEERLGGETDGQNHLTHNDQRKRRKTEPEGRGEGIHHEETSPAELQRHLGCLIAWLKHQPAAEPFLKPVDPVALNVPDYFDIVKKPMDISTIRRKNQAGEYRELKDLEHDLHLMLNNCYLYNPPDHWICRAARHLEKQIEERLRWCANELQVARQAHGLRKRTSFRASWHVQE